MSETVTTWQPKSPEITMTPRAVEHVQNQLQRRGKGIGMRFGIKKSGCSGFAYLVDLIDKAKDNDLVYQVAENLVVVVVSSDRPVSVIQGGVELTAQCEYGPLSKLTGPPPTIEQWLRSKN